ncbi:MAG: site-specific DNA-methyltransferase, partial [Treponema sp.]|nr:site-specific DNA-methyltransferase [Treponema sp.]
RLRIARELLSEKGVIFISIDDNEQADLKLLCDEVFGDKNYISDIIWNSRKSVSNDAVVSLNHNYTLIYTKNLREFNLTKSKFKLPDKGEGFSNPDNDFRGLWKADPFDSPGIRPNLTYKIRNPNTGVEFLPPEGRCWRTGEKEYKEFLADNRIVFGKTGNSKPQLKRFLSEAQLKGLTPKSIWDDCGTATNGTQEIQEIFGTKVFDTPKPVDFLTKILQLSTFNSPFSTVLDFFAGSGTTGHAVLKLNAEDGGKRKFILCTNNENGICRDITYERLKTVITGERKDGSKYSDGLSGSLKYFKVDFVEITEKEYYEYADKLLLHVRELVELENAVDFEHDRAVAIVLTEEELEEFCKKIVGASPTMTRTLYVGHDVLLSKAQKELLKQKEISVKIIPQYYYPELNG